VNIQKAVKKATERGACIARPAHPDIKIKPTNTEQNCIVMMSDGYHPSKRGWQPSADELMCCEWIVVD